MASDEASKLEKIESLLHFGKQFLMKLYHNIFFKEDLFKHRDVIIEEIKNYCEVENLELDEKLYSSMCLVLEITKFLIPKEDEQNLLTLNQEHFFKFYDTVIEDFDELQIQNAIEEKMKKRKGNDFSSSELQEKFLPDLSVNDTSLCFRNQEIQEIHNKFVFRENLSCFICQKTFKTKEKYSQHIEDHINNIHFKINRKTRDKSSQMNKNRNRMLKLSFKPSLIFPTLRFSIQNSRRWNPKSIIVRKIIIIRQNCMSFIMEEKIPFIISPGEMENFYIDSNYLNNETRYPVFIIFNYENENENSPRMVEQFFFIKSKNYPLEDKSTRQSEYVMKFIELEDYFPPEKIKTFCKKNSFVNEDLIALEPRLREYFNANKNITRSNLCSTFEIFLQIEDVTNSKEYDVLQMNERKIISANQGYYFECEDLSEKINIKEILNNSDEIFLLKGEKFKNNKTDPSKNHVQKLRIDGISSTNAFRNFLLDTNSEKSELGSVKGYIKGTIDKVGDNEIFFSLRDKLEKLDCNFKYNVSFSPNRTNFILQYQAIKLLSTSKIDYIYETLFPPTTVNSTEPLVRHSSFDWFSKSIASNKEQMEAVENIVNGLHGSVPYIVFGPPGTGKTTTIVEAILQLWITKKAKRILVTAGSNTACDEIGVRLQNHLAIKNNKRVLYRVYSQSMEKRIDTIDNDLKLSSNLADNHQYYPSFNILSEYTIIIATSCIAGKFANSEISSDCFSHIFIDECGAITEPEALLSIVGLMSTKGRLIISGDPKQLGPVLQNKKVEELGLGVSLIERLLKRDCYKVNETTGSYNKSIQIRLCQNYRTHPDILHLSNRLYYNNDLKACASSDITSWGLGWYKLPSKNFPIIFNVTLGETEKDQKSSSLYNKMEINVVMRYVKEIMFFGINGHNITESDIGVISPYKKQGTLLRSELNRRGWYKIETGSVENFQGKEKPIIIVSTVRSKTSGVGFLNNPRRLNVTLTRAQALFVIVGNPYTLEMSSEWREVIEYCRNNNSMSINRTTDISKNYPDLSDVNNLEDYFKKLFV